MWPIWQPVFRDRLADRILRPPGGHQFCRSRSFSIIKFQQHPIDNLERPARMAAAGANGPVRTALGECGLEPPKVDCEHGRRINCGWCQFGVSAFDGEVLQARYLQECQRLMKARLSMEEWNSQLHETNRTMCRCLLDLSQDERKKLNFVYLEAEPQMDPLAPDVLDALDQLRPGTTESQRDGTLSGASAASGGKTKMSEGPASAEDDSADELDSDTQIKKIIAQYGPKSREHWIVTLESRGLWSSWIRMMFLRDLSPDVEYRVQYNDGQEWPFMSENDSREAMRLAATPERRGCIAFHNDRGRSSMYNIWWTQGFEGIQQNTASLTCRFIRCVILDAGGQRCAGSQLRFVNPACERDPPDGTKDSGKSWDPEARDRLRYKDGAGVSIKCLKPGTLEC